MDRRRYLAGIGTAAVAGLAGCEGSDNNSDDGGDSGAGDETETGDGGGSDGDSESQLQGPTEEDVELVDLQYREWTDSEVETVKSEATKLDYNDVARNAEDRAGSYVAFRAGVVQNLESQNVQYTALLLTLDRSGNNTLYGSWTGGRFLRGDVVRVWAEVLGTETYQAANAGQRTVPAIAIADMELEETESS